MDNKSVIYKKHTYNEHTTRDERTTRKPISNPEQSTHVSQIEPTTKYAPSTKSLNESFKSKLVFNRHTIDEPSTNPENDDNKNMETKISNYPINQFLELDEEKKKILALVLNNQIGGGDINNMSYNLNLLNTYVSLVNPLYIVNQLLMLEMDNITLNPINLTRESNTSPIESIVPSIPSDKESDTVRRISDGLNTKLSESRNKKDSESKRRKRREQKNYECAIIKDEISRLLERYHHILLDDYKWFVESSREKDKQIIKFTNTTKKGNMNTIINYLRRIIKLLKQEFPLIDIDIRKDYDSIDNCARNLVCLILEH